MKNTEINETTLKLMIQTNKRYEDMVTQLADSVQGVANLLTYEQLNTDEFDYLVDTVAIMSSLQMKTGQLVESLNRELVD